MRRGGRSAELASLLASTLDEKEGSGGHENGQRESNEGEQGLRFDHDDLRFVNDMAGALLPTESLQGISWMRSWRYWGNFGASADDNVVT